MDEYEQQKIKASDASQLLQPIYAAKFNEIYSKNMGSKVSTRLKLFCCWILNNQIKLRLPINMKLHFINYKNLIINFILY